MKTPQTSLMQRHESDSDGPSEDEQDTVRNKIKQLIAKKKKNSMNEDHVYKRLVSQGNKLNDEPF
jgi:hypothetical protein